MHFKLFLSHSEENVSGKVLLSCHEWMYGTVREATEYYGMKSLAVVISTLNPVASHS